MTVSELRLTVWETMSGREGVSRRDSDWLVESVLGLSRSQLIARSTEFVDEAHCGKIRLRAQRAARGWPIQYIVGSIPFHRVTLRVDPSVLIPRPETEQLVAIVERYLNGVTNPRVLDVCTGSGSIALAISAACPTARVEGVDVCEGALATAVENGARLGRSIRWWQGDVLLRDLSDILATRALNSFDVIVSNPPYISAAESADVARDVRAYEPLGALFSYEDPLAFFRRISRDSAPLLRCGGLLAFEVHEDRATAVSEIVLESGYCGVEIYRDDSGKDRFVVATAES